MFYFLISIHENIFHKHEKILDIDFHLMLLEHDQFHKPINYILFKWKKLKKILHIHEDTVEQVDQVVGESESP